MSDWDMADSGSQVNLISSSPPRVTVARGRSGSDRRPNSPRNDSIGRVGQSVPTAVDYIKRATETELMHSASYVKLKDNYEVLRERVRQAEKKAADLELQVKQLRRAEERRERLEKKMSSTLTQIDEIAGGLKLALAALPSNPASGPEPSRDIFAQVVSTYQMPKRPSDRKKAAQLFWDEQDFKALKNDGISKPVKKSGNDDEGEDNKAPACFVDQHGLRIIYDEYRAGRQSIRDVATSIEQQQPGMLIKDFMANGEDVKVQFQNKVYPKHSWLAQCNGHYKLYKLCSSVFSDHIDRMRKKVAAAKGKASSTIPVKRESSLEEDIKPANIKKARKTPKGSVSAGSSKASSSLSSPQQAQDAQIAKMLEQNSWSPDDYTKFDPDTTAQDDAEMDESQPLIPSGLSAESISTFGTPPAWSASSLVHWQAQQANHQQRTIQVNQPPPQNLGAHQPAQTAQTQAQNTGVFQHAQVFHHLHSQNPGVVQNAQVAQLQVVQPHAQVAPQPHTQNLAAAQHAQVVQPQNVQTHVQSPGAAQHAQVVPQTYAQNLAAVQHAQVVQPQNVQPHVQSPSVAQHAQVIPQLHGQNLAAAQHAQVVQPQNVAQTTQPNAQAAQCIEQLNAQPIHVAQPPPFKPLPFGETTPGLSDTTIFKNSGPATSTTMYPSIASSVRSNLANAVSAGSSLSSSSSIAANTMPSVTHGFTEPNPLPEPPRSKANKENENPKVSGTKAKAARGEGKFILSNYKSKRSGMAVFAHTFAKTNTQAINKTAQTKDLTAAWNALSPDQQKSYEDQKCR